MDCESAFCLCFAFDLTLFWRCRNVPRLVKKEREIAERRREVMSVLSVKICSIRLIYVLPKESADWTDFITLSSNYFTP